MGGYPDDAQEKARVINDMRSQDNATALRAVEIMRERGWLTDGTLKGADLQGANLEGAALEAIDMPDEVRDGRHLLAVDLTGTNLRDAHLARANLQRAFMREADLAGADLRAADLQRADLRGADLRGAILQKADLQIANLAEAYLEGAFMEGAFLAGANLRRAILRHAHLDGAFLPDGTLWTLTVDLMRFTHPTSQDAKKLARPLAVSKLAGERGTHNQAATPTVAPLPADIIAQLDQLADEARANIASAQSDDLVAYWRGVTYGLEMAAAELRSSKR